MKRMGFVVVAILTTALVFAGGQSEQKSAAGPTAVTVYFHSGKGPERETLAAQISDFNKMQSKYSVTAKQLPEGSYTEQVNAAAMSKDLPDLLDFDGPFVYNFAWAGYLTPIDKYVTKQMRDDILPSIIAQGTYNGKLWSLGTFDSGLGIYANKKYLQEAGIRIPTGTKDAWSGAEFEAALKKLKAIPGVDYPLDLKMNYGKGEWFTYGFSPILQSFGADLIDRNGYKTASGVLNGAAAVKAMTMFQSWFKNGYTKYNPGNDTDFADGKAALSLVGHWQYNPLKKALGDNLILLPMPAFGGKSVTGMGSWNWGITSSSKSPDGAWAFLSYLMEPDQILRMTGANGAVPARKSALAKDPLFKQGGDLWEFVDQLENTAVPRPQTPAYSVITQAFQDVIDNIAQGSDVKAQLDKATEKINQDLKDNNYYQSK